MNWIVIYRTVPQTVIRGYLKWNIKRLSPVLLTLSEWTLLLQNCWFYHFYICGKLSVICSIHDFSVWLRTGSYPVDINRFQSHTGRKLTILLSNIIKQALYNQFREWHGNGNKNYTNIPILLASYQSSNLAYKNWGKDYVNAVLSLRSLDIL